jgi:hypothetical protein
LLKSNPIPIIFLLIKIRASNIKVYLKGLNSRCNEAMLEIGEAMCGKECLWWRLYMHNWCQRDKWCFLTGLEVCSSQLQHRMNPNKITLQETMKRLVWSNHMDVQSKAIPTIGNMNLIIPWNMCTIRFLTITHFEGLPQIDTKTSLACRCETSAKTYSTAPVFLFSQAFYQCSLQPNYPYLSQSHNLALNLITMTWRW